MAVKYLIQISHGFEHVSNCDFDRAIYAIDCALDREEIITDDQFIEAHRAFRARCDGEEHDAALAAAFERIQQSGDIALTEGWRDPNGASLYLGAAG